MKRLVLLMVLSACVSAAFAIDAGKAFDDPEMQARYEAIIAEVRCVKCQNQTIKDSNALIANDLRREIRRLLSEGLNHAGMTVSNLGDIVVGVEKRAPRGIGEPYALATHDVKGVVVGEFQARPEPLPTSFEQ